MSITNLNNTHLSTSETENVKTALTTLEKLLEAINVNLTAEDRRRYGSINEQNKLFVNKVADYHHNQPMLQTTQVDWAEFDKDYDSRAFLESLITRIERLVVKLSNAKVLHDYDNYQAALTDYAYTNFMAGSGVDGYETKRKELKQFFVRPPKSGLTTPTEG